MSYQMIGGDTKDINAVVNQMNQNIAQLKVEEQTKIIKDDQGTRVVILDKNGLRTTAPGSGVDVYTASPEQLTSNSANNVFKIIDTDVITITKPASQDVVDSDPIAHGLDFPPLIIASDEDGSNLPIVRVVPEDSSGLAGAVYHSVETISNATEFYFRVTTPDLSDPFWSEYSSNLTISIRYYILQETAATS